VFPAGVPCSVIRQIWGEGPRAGMYPISGQLPRQMLACLGSAMQCTRIEQAPLSAIDFLMIHSSKRKVRSSPDIPRVPTAGFAPHFCIICPCCIHFADTELYWFVCFDAPADSPTPSTPEGLRQEALNLVSGWQWGAAEVVERTPLENLVRSRISDRCVSMSLLSFHDEIQSYRAGRASACLYVLLTSTAGARSCPAALPVAVQVGKTQGCGLRRWDLPNGSGAGAVTLAGDALHPMTPNLGQGGCTALEDAIVLARLMRDRGVPALLERAAAGNREAVVGAIGEAFREYEKERARRWATQCKRCAFETVPSWK
jgi:hypothetical protein